MNSEQTMILVAVVAFIYVQLIMRFTFGWFSLDKRISAGKNASFSTCFSVIIAVRNEEENITLCLEAIARQNYSRDLFEVIIVDDHSTDSTLEVVKAFVHSHSEINFQLLGGVGEGKKSAVTRGVKAATGRLILVTDADCVMSEGWISSFALAYEQKGFRCLSGPVKMAGKGIFAGMQGLEFMSLIGSGAGSISSGMPVMCNGANFCYEKSAFEAVGGFEDNQHYASGDDVFLMLKISKQYGSRAVTFLKDRAAIVTTPSQKGLQAFFRQRMRWTSKSPGYTDFGIILTSVSVFLIHLGLLIGFVYGWFSDFWQPFMLLFISKFIIDLPLLIALAAFMHQKRLLAYFLPLQLLMPFYVVITAVGGLLSTVSWKGRPVK